MGETKDAARHLGVVHYDHGYWWYRKCIARRTLQVSWSLHHRPHLLPDEHCLLRQHLGNDHPLRAVSMDVQSELHTSYRVALRSRVRCLIWYDFDQHRRVRNRQRWSVAQLHCPCSLLARLWCGHRTQHHHLPDPMVYPDIHNCAHDTYLDLPSLPSPYHWSTCCETVSKGN